MTAVVTLTIVGGGIILGTAVKAFALGRCRDISKSAQRNVAESVPSLEKEPWKGWVDIITLVVSRCFATKAVYMQEV